MRASRILSSVFVASLFVAACGGDEDSDPSGDDVADDDAGTGSDDDDVGDDDVGDDDVGDDDVGDDDVGDDDVGDDDVGDDDVGDDDVGDDDAGVDGGADDDVEGDGGVDGGADDDVEGDGGTDGGADDEGDGGVDAEAPLPEGACADTPADPADGTYADCDATLNGGTCALTCTDEDFVGGNATCTDGVWTEAACVPLGTLEAVIGDASNGTAVADAQVYVAGFFDPLTEVCADSDYCEVSDASGAVSFDAFPTGPQSVVIVKEGFDEIALPVEIAPGDNQTIHLDALPTGFLDGNIVVMLGWSVNRDLDLVVNAPAEAATCVYFDAEGALDADPFAQLDHDTKSRAGGGTETIRIALNEAGTGPHYDGTYSVVVTTGVEAGLASATPVVRVIKAGANGAAEVSLFAIPEDAVAGATDWHVVDIHGDGTITNGGTTAINGGMPSDMPCINTVYGL